MTEGPSSLWREARAEMRRHPLSRMAAALAYFTLFSLPGILVVAVAVLGSVYGESGARDRLMAEVARTAGPQAAESVRQILEHAPRPGEGGWIRGAVAVVGLLLGATGAFLELQGVLNALWGARSRAKRMGIGKVVLKRLVSFAMVCGVAALLLVFFLVGAALSVAGDFLEERGLGGISAPALRLLELSLSAAFLTAGIAAIFVILPDCPVRWRDVWLGAAVAGGVLTAATFPLGLYLAHAGPGKSFGTSGSLAVLVFATYAGSLVLLLGAVVTRAQARCRGAP
jgi:membrane protein